MKNWRTFAPSWSSVSIRFLSSTARQLLGRPLGRLAIEERLDDAVDEDARGAHEDDSADDDDEQDRQDAARRGTG